jgi:hypothetical protein
VTFSPVIPTTWDPTSQMINDFIEAIVAAFQVAVPGVIRKQWSEVPASFSGENPLIYLGDVTETIRHDMGTRSTLFTGTIGYVDRSPDNEEANTRSNAFRDYMREVFTANARIYSTGIFQQTSMAEAPVPPDGPPRAFMHLVLTYTFALQEGRN